jgi:hypothetical protein
MISPLFKNIPESFIVCHNDPALKKALGEIFFKRRKINVHFTKIIPSIYDYVGGVLGAIACMHISFCKCMHGALGLFSDSDAIGIKFLPERAR